MVRSRRVKKAIRPGENEMETHSNYSLVLTLLFVIGLVLVIVALVEVVNSGAAIFSVTPAPPANPFSSVVMPPPPSPVNPVISYFKQTSNAGVLRFVSCGNLSCSAGNVFQTLDSGGANYYVGQGNDMIRDANHIPIIAYEDGTLQKIKVLKCHDSVCLTGFSTSILDTNTGNYISPSLAFSANGNPMVAYTQFNGGDLKFALCGNASCSANSSIVIVDANGLTGYVPVLARGSDNLPIITYRHALATGPGNDYAKVAHCENASCSSKTITILDETYNGFDHDMLIAPDGKPIIVYTRNIPGPGYTALLRCGNVRCNAGNVTSNIEPYVGQGSYSLEIGSDSLPIFAYNSPLVSGGTIGYLKVTHCGNLSCSTGNVSTVLDVNGVTPSLAIGSDGNPLISYYDPSSQDLKAVKCTNKICTTFNPPSIVEGASQAATYIGQWNSVR